MFTELKLNKVLLEAPLDTPQLMLEPIIPQHAAELWSGLQDQRLYRFIPQDPPKDLEALIDRFTKLSTRMSPNGSQLWLNWAVRLRESNQYIGLMQATVNENYSSSIAYFIFSQWQRRGFCKESIDRVTNYMFDQLNVEFIVAEIDVRNTASIKLVETLGFQRVGFVSEADFFKGSPSSEYKYRLSRINRPIDK